MTYTIDYYNFNDFIEKIKNEPTKIDGDYQSSSKEIYYTDHETFYDTKNFQENLKFLEKGYKTEINFSVDFLRNYFSEYSKKTDYYMSYEGLFVDIPTYVTGENDCMVQNFDTEEKSNKFIKININGTYSHRITKKTLQFFGESIYFLIDFLESIGYKIELNIFTWLKYSDSSSSKIYFIKIKDFETFLDTDRLKYFLLSTSFFRRSIFRLMELESISVRKKFAEHYGRVNFEIPIELQNDNSINFEGIKENNNQNYFTENLKKIIEKYISK